MTAGSHQLYQIIVASVLKTDNLSSYTHYQYWIHAKKG